MFGDQKIAWFRRSSTLALGAACLLLNSCDQRPYPKAPQDQAPPAPPAELMGAPTPPPPHEATPADAADAAPAPATPSVSDAPPPAAPATVAPDVRPDARMDPIPNPPEQPAATTPKLGAAKPTVVLAAAPPSAKSAPPLAAEQTLAGAPPAGRTSSDPASAEEALKSAIAKALVHNAVLAPPTKAAPGQPAQARLTLTAAFGEAVRKAVTQSGLVETGAPVNVTVTLSGRGYAISPQTAQSQPLLVGQPLVFAWLTTLNSRKHGDLQAEVCIEAPAGAEPLCAGAVKAAAPGFRLGGRSLGVGILLTILGLVSVWMFRGRRGPPSRSLDARRAARRAALTQSQVQLPG